MGDGRIGDRHSAKVSMGYPRNDGRRRTLLSPRRIRLCADEYSATHAGVRALALETGVVRLYSVVVILGRWVRVGCATLCGVHKSSFLPACDLR